jgi:anti-sigma regulatory factor (Ser/Thr protein kinase)
MLTERNKNRLDTINNNFDSYQKLIDFYHSNSACFLDNINLKISGFFAANTCSMLGAILYLFQKSLNNIKIDIAEGLEILLKNNFLSFFGQDKWLDINNTTISYQMLSITDDKYFKNYIYRELLNKNDLPQMSYLVKEKIGEAIYEIFNNAVIHSKTDKIFVCGQFFPNKHTIEFMITDIGIGIKGSIKNKFNKELTSLQAIQWAIQDKNTTKDVTGGIGFALLHEFIEKNKGKIQIISNNGFYEFCQNGIKTREFNNDFPGTVVNLSIKTDDISQYILSTEESDISF